MFYFLELYISILFLLCNLYMMQYVSGPAEEGTTPKYGSCFRTRDKKCKLSFLLFITVTILALFQMSMHVCLDCLQTKYLVNNISDHYLSLSS